MDATSGFYRFPARHNNLILFTYEDDIWLYVMDDTFALRLTNSLGMAMMPVFSPDGRQMAYSANDEGGREVFLMHLKNGAIQRLTYRGFCEPVCFKDNQTLITRSPSDNAHAYMELFEIDIQSGERRKINAGAAWTADYSDKGDLLIGRNCKPLYRWKRYRGGTVGQIWQKSARGKEFERLLPNFEGNLTDPTYAANRIFFLADHEGYGNLYSINRQGGDLQKHSDHFDYYARDLKSYGDGVIYSCGGDIWTFDYKNDKKPVKINIKIRSSGNFGRSKYVSAMPYVQGCGFDGNGEKMAITTRGQLFVAPTFGGSGMSYGDEETLRYRYPIWLKSGRELATIAFVNRQEEIQIIAVGQPEKNVIRKIRNPKLGRIYHWVRHPYENIAVMINHRQECWIIDLDKGNLQLVEKNEFGAMRRACFSPCGHYIAYSSAVDAKRIGIKISPVKNPKPQLVLDPILTDAQPTFSADGKFLYFIGVRDLHPVYSGTHFQLSFPAADRIYGIALKAGTVMPELEEAQKLFSVQEGLDQKNKLAEGSKGQKSKGEKTKTSKVKPKEKRESPSSSTPNGPEKIQIDWDGIQDRVFGIKNFELSNYLELAATKDHLLVLESKNRPRTKTSTDRYLLAYHFKDQKLETWESGLTNFDLSLDRKRFSYQKGRHLRLVSADKKPEGGDTSHSKKTGWLNMERFSLEIRPRREWRCMYDEAWLLQKEFFWTEDMSKIEWNAIYERYLPLLNKISSRSELSDLIWEMQGELGTSHCYEMPAEQSRHPHSRVQRAYLGGTFSYDERQKGYRLEEILRGDSWREDSYNPLVGLLNMKVGDTIHAINGRSVADGEALETKLLSLDAKLLNITYRHRGEKEMRTKAVPILRSEGEILYREWVEKNRALTRKLSKNQLGYVHIPDMGPHGFAQFYRYFLSEAQYRGLIVDVRYNRGGHVSQHILRMLCQKTLGYDVSRWLGVMTYPHHPAPSTLVAITNEFAGSDGDIFCHAFKMLNLGPLIGTRTWGGVIGIMGRHLVDGTYVSQPEFSHWFKDVGYQVENYGTDPTEFVDRDPNDFIAGRDPQLERAIAVALADIKKKKEKDPDLTQRPDLRPPNWKN